MVRPVPISAVRDVLDYEQRTGRFTWKVRVNQKSRVGAEAGSISVHGYRVIGLWGSLYRANRLAWALAHGEDPGPSFVDHINGDRSDDRLDNLRLASNGENRANSRTAAAAGFKGVYPNNGRGPNGRVAWAAKIRKDRKLIHLGTFPTKEEAHAAYVAAALTLHGQYARAA